MRLINARKLIEQDTVQFEEFFEERIPKYVILSHTWGDDEVSFQDAASSSARIKAGFSKLKETCCLALEAKFEYTWIDTCCIDKSSSAELTESINSMFRWYQNAEICYAYLSDLVPGDKAAMQANLPKCRWFTRGWTLQELIAPRRVDFLDQQWHYSGSKDELRDEISAITEIDTSALIGISHPDFLNSFSIAHRMSWASRRQTTRTEDEAYCLLGIFDVSMPLIYGEGNKAFRRLQEEIVKRSNDLTIFAWSPSENTEYCSVLAPSPAVFSGSRDVKKFTSAFFDSEFALNNKGLRMTTSLWRVPVRQPGAETLRYFLRLGGNPSNPTGVFLIKVGPGFFFRDGRIPLNMVSKSETGAVGLRTSELYVATDPPTTTEPVDLTSFSRISFAVPFHPDWHLFTLIPEEFWDDANDLFFGAVNQIIQVLEIQILVPGTGVKVLVVALCETRASPVTCLIFNAEDDERHGRLARYLFQPRNVNKRFRMRDLQWDYPDIEELTDYIIVTIKKEMYMIKAVMQLGIMERVSTTTPIYSLTFEITRVGSASQVKDLSLHKRSSSKRERSPEQR